MLLGGAASWAGMWALNALWRVRNLSGVLDGDWAALAHPRATAGSRRGSRGDLRLHVQPGRSPLPPSGRPAPRSPRCGARGADAQLTAAAAARAVPTGSTGRPRASNSNVQNTCAASSPDSSSSGSRS